MILTLQAAKDKYGFKLYNFCIMPTHIHLLITAAPGTSLSRIMQWIKTRSAKYWNSVHGSTDHVWGTRFFARPAKDVYDYFSIYNYIDQNPVKAGLSARPEDWKACGAYYIARNISGLLDFTEYDQRTYLKLLPPPKKGDSHNIGLLGGDYIAVYREASAQGLFPYISRSH
jgi:putative transposase